MEPACTFIQGCRRPDAIDASNGRGVWRARPFSVTENLSGGVHYLADLLNRFHGEMRLAVAAYYCGTKDLELKGLSYSNPDVVAYVEVGSTPIPARIAHRSCPE